QPSIVQASFAVEPAESSNGSVAVGFEERFRQNNAGAAAITLELALIRVELEFPKDGFFLEWLERALQRWQERSIRALWVTMKTQPKVQLWIGVSHEKPTIKKTRPPTLCNQGRNQVGEQRVDAGGSRV